MTFLLFGQLALHQWPGCISLHDFEASMSCASKKVNVLNYISVGVGVAPTHQPWGFLLELYTSAVYGDAKCILGRPKLCSACAANVNISRVIELLRAEI